MRYFLHLEYNGTNYHGWQKQPNGITVEEVLETSMSNVLGKEIDLLGCGRTDAGVHARDFYAHFDYDELENEEINYLVKKLNIYLPFDIKIKEILKVKPETNARFDALSRTYKYYISKEKQPFNDDFCFFCPYLLDVEKMNTAAKILYQYDDFSCFSKSHTQTDTNVCKIMYVHFEEKKDYIVFTIKANRFLRNMVRAIVGTLLEVGKGKMKIEEFETVIESKDRSRAGISMTGKALFLEEVEYDKRIFLEKLFIY
jgi:tRNA pseudouridine38-40 synthase